MMKEKDRKRSQSNKWKEHRKKKKEAPLEKKKKTREPTLLQVRTATVHIKWKKKRHAWAELS